MAGFYGADVEQLDMLAFALEREGRALEDLLRRLDSRLQSVPWNGPDAERSRSEWTSSLFPRCLQAADGLVSAASVVRRNASDQRDASGGLSFLNPVVPFPVPIPGMPNFPGDRVFPRLPGFELPSIPGLLPGIAMPPWERLPVDLLPRQDEGTAWRYPMPMSPADLFEPSRDAVESRIPGTPWTWGAIGGLVPGASDVLAVRDMADQLSRGQVPIHAMVDTAAGELRKAGVAQVSPHLYLAGAAVGTWNTAAEEFGKADFSAQTRATALDFVTSDPWGAASAASEAVVSFLQILVKNFL
ncbi:MAG: hypothetical protein Q8M65_03675 [Rhodoglobus sp.]|nr:hypothetical protein [Rhodoglobus sp.]